MLKFTKDGIDWSREARDEKEGENTYNFFYFYGHTQLFFCEKRILNSFIND
jgi:hypothetical protein